MISAILISAGILGALLDGFLHVLQLHDLPWLRFLQTKAAWITLLSAFLIGLSLLAQFNAGTLIMDIFIAVLAVTSIKGSNSREVTTHG